MRFDGFAKRFSLQFNFSERLLSLNCDLSELGVEGSVSSNIDDLLALRLQNIFFKVSKSLEVYFPLKSQLLFGPDEEVKKLGFSVALKGKLGDLPKSLDGKVSLTYQHFLELLVGSLRHPAQTSALGLSYCLPFNMFLPETKQELLVNLGVVAPLQKPLKGLHTSAEVFELVKVTRHQKKGLPIAKLEIPISFEKEGSIDVLLDKFIPNFSNKYLQSRVHIDFSDVSKFSLNGNLQIENVSINGELPIGAAYEIVRVLFRNLWNFEDFFESSMEIVEQVKPLDESFVREVNEAVLQIINSPEANREQLAKEKSLELDQKFQKEMKILFECMRLHAGNALLLNQIALILKLSKILERIFSFSISESQKVELDQKSVDELTSAQKWTKNFSKLTKICEDIIEHPEKYLWDPTTLVFLEIAFGIKIQDDVFVLPADYVSILQNQK